MGKRKKVPEDIMGTILGGGYSPPGDEPVPPGAPGPQSTAASADENGIFWEPRPERTGITFNLSKQVSRELDRLRQELQLEEGIRSSNSEIAELALRIALEDARRRGKESELLRSLNRDPADQPEEVDETRSMPVETTNGPGHTVERSVYGSGYIVETTYDEQREVVGEEVVGNVADLPVEEEYLDKEGRLLSLSRDELGNIFERVMDDGPNTLGVRLVREAG